MSYYISVKAKEITQSIQTPSIFRLSVEDEVIASVGEVVVGFRVHPAAALVLNRVVFLQVRPSGW